MIARICLITLCSTHNNIISIFIFFWGRNESHYLILSCASWNTTLWTFFQCYTSKTSVIMSHWPQLSCLLNVFQVPCATWHVVHKHSINICWINELTFSKGQNYRRGSFLKVYILESLDYIDGRMCVRVCGCNSFKKHSDSVSGHNDEISYVLWVIICLYFEEEIPLHLFPFDIFKTLLIEKYWVTWHFDRIVMIINTRHCLIELFMVL